jgi:hypothetical protein
MPATKKRKYSFKPVFGIPDSRDVVRDGFVIGRIHYTWSRLGGWGWNHRLVGKTYRSMSDAATAMEKQTSG